MLKIKTIFKLKNSLNLEHVVSFQIYTLINEPSFRLLFSSNNFYWWLLITVIHCSLSMTFSLLQLVRLTVHPPPSVVMSQNTVLLVFKSGNIVYTPSLLNGRCVRTISKPRINAYILFDKKWIKSQQTTIVFKFCLIFFFKTFLRDLKKTSPSFNLKFECTSRVMGPWIDMSVFWWSQLDLLNMDFISSTDKSDDVYEIKTLSGLSFYI